MPAARLFRGGAAICSVLGFRTVMNASAGAPYDSAGDAAFCRFTLPVRPPINLDEAAEYELVFDNGARFPIRIRQFFIRADDRSTAVRDVFAELI